MEVNNINSSVLVVLMFILLSTMYVYEYTYTVTTTVADVPYNEVETTNVEPPKERYIIYNSKCRLPDLDPFNQDVLEHYRKETYISCRTRDLLTYIENDGNVATIHINKTVEPLYAISGTTCRLSYVSRIDDMNIKLTDYVEFESGTVLKGNTIMVRCYSKWTEEEVYVNAHTVAVLDEDLRKRVARNDTKPNVLLIGIDSISRLNMYRTMPKTIKFLSDLDFIEYTAYNKVEDNTFPNLMAVLTGSNYTRIVEYCSPYSGHVDECDFIWKDFEKAGYITAYAEDETTINTFNYLKKGFSKQPTDFFYMPYMLASESISKSMVDHRTYCAGPETSIARILNVIKDFSISLRAYPKFGLFWASSASHDYLNSPSRFDEIYMEFFKEMHLSGVMNNTIVVFFSDHGLRFGNILLTRSGWLEERLPFLYFSLPPSFQNTYPQKYESVKTNAARLTSPYDLHLMLKDVLYMYSDLTKFNGSDACPTCRSLFEEADEIRSCEEAAIPMHYCTCTGYKYLDPGSALSKNAVSFIMDSLNNRTLNSDVAASRCTLLKINEIVSASISQSDDQWYKNDTYLLVVFKTIPETILQATVNLTYDPDGQMEFQLQGSISRLDFYKFSSQCISAWAFKIYCYCRFNQLLDMNYFSFWFEV